MPDRTNPRLRGFGRSRRMCEVAQGTPIPAATLIFSSEAT